MTEASRPRALVVEDEAMIRALSRAALERAGLDVDEAADGLEAVSYLHDSSRVYAIMFVDLALLGTRGEDVVARAGVMRPGVPVVVCTGEPVDSVPGAVAVLPKPYRPSQLIALARRLVPSLSPPGSSPG